jgi:hypothetical protein
MPFERDYILRLIEILAKAVARIVAMRDRGQYEEAVSELDAAGRTLLGVELALLEAIGPEPIAAQLGHPEKVEALARLVDERVALERARKAEAAAVRWTALAKALRAWKPPPR